MRHELRDRKPQILYCEKKKRDTAMASIEIPDEQAAALKAQAAAHGFTLENWIQKLAVNASPIDWAQCPVVESVPGKVSGAWVLRDTRMPVSARSLRTSKPELALMT